MSSSSVVTLGALRLQARQRSDLVNSPAVPDDEFNGYISNSYKELYDLLVSAYGNDYFMAKPFQIGIGTAQFYPLPDDHYKLLGVDLMYSMAPTGWVTLKRFDFIDRNKWAFPNANSNYLGYTNLRYRLSGNDLELIPVPAAGQTLQLWYVPKPTSLQFMPIAKTTMNLSAITVSDTGGINSGMNVAGPGILPGTTVTAVDTLTGTVGLSIPAFMTQAAVTLSFWDDSVKFDGISGWEEYVIIDAAIKAMVKQEQDTTELKIMKAMMIDRINGMAEGRDIGQAQHVSDTLAINGWGYDGAGSGLGGYGDSGFWGY